MPVKVHFTKLNIVIRMTKKKNDYNMFGVMGKIGDNYVVRDTPCLIPKENMRIFNAMRKQSNVSSFGNYPSPFNIWRG